MDREKREQWLQSFIKMREIGHRHCMDHADKFNRFVKENKDLLLPLAGLSTLAMVAGIFGATQVVLGGQKAFIAREELKKARLNAYEKGKIKF